MPAGADLSKDGRARCALVVGGSLGGLTLLAGGGVSARSAPGSAATGTAPGSATGSATTLAGAGLRDDGFAPTRDEIEQKVERVRALMRERGLAGTGTRIIGSRHLIPTRR